VVRDAQRQPDRNRCGAVSDLWSLSSGSAATKTRSIAANWAVLSRWIDASPVVLPVSAEAAADAAPIAASASAHATTTPSAPRAVVNARDTGDEHTGRRFDRGVAKA
jgi:hypothetical protein